MEPNEMSWSELLESAVSAQEADEYSEARRLANEALVLLALARGVEASHHLSRLLGNAVYQTQERRFYKCPRCEASLMSWVKGKDWPEKAAMSRTSRNEDDAPIPVCSTCGEREAHAAERRAPTAPETWRTGAGIPLPPDWPLSIEELLAEDRACYEFWRSTRFEGIDVDELED